MDRVDTFQIEWICTRLINEYARLCDAERWTDVAALFTADGEMARPSAPDMLIAGREAILASFLSRAPRYSRHICSNIMVDVESATVATAESRILLFTGEDTGDFPALSGLPLIGEYSDRFIFTEGRWQFFSRRGRLLFRP